MRNVVTLSNIPKELHDWLKVEAIRRGRLVKKRVGIHEIVTQAVKEYKEQVEKTTSKHDVKTPTIELFRKKIMPSELTRGCICVPKAQRFYFGTVGNTIAMKDAIDDSTCLVPVRSQYRLDIRDWYKHHSNIKPGDEIIFKQKNGSININTLII
jgi:hypothetical protein